MINQKSLYSHGFLRAAVCIPEVKVADPKFNAQRTIELSKQASDQNAALALFPELGLSAYSNEDLFQQASLLDATKDAIQSVVTASTYLNPVLIVGAPLVFEGKLFNCGITIYRGKILGIASKSYLPNYREFYEKRHFTSVREAIFREVSFNGQTIPFGNDLIFVAINLPGFKIHSDLCEDVWTPIPPSTYAAMAGATLLTNLSASNITVGKAAYRRNLCAGQSGKCLAAYLYSAAGPGESTTDVAWDGHAMIYENGEQLAESTRFSDKGHMITADIDLERLEQDRMRQGSFSDSAFDVRDRLRQFRHIPFQFEIPQGDIPLKRNVARYPFVPADSAELDQHCYEAYNIQAHGLLKRLSSSGIDKLVIGVSGGLDSTQALIVAANIMDRLQLPRTHILAYTMPGFATSKSTHGNAHKLMKALGVTVGEIDIRPSCLQMFKDLKHPYAEGKPVYDATFENVQAGERTSHLFRLANMHNALVMGTGDLTEAALGWCTYGVGDHMSHYNVNASVPKTLIQYLIRWVITSKQFDTATNDVLQAILDTEISPELIPSSEGADAKPAQSSAAKIGPFELQDFNLYYITRFGFKPTKVAFMANHAWGDATKGNWPMLQPLNKRPQYSPAEVKQWLGVFINRFFKNQFKRTCVPNGPKVGSGGSLSPRGDWRAPSDAEPTVWLENLKEVPEN
jgi:NAD+ synthase (glutamine-hydrolysing)